MWFDWFSSTYDEVKDDIASLRDGTKHAFEHIKHEFDDHLNAINQNTSEIQAVYDVLSDLDRRIDRVEERLDTLQMHVNPEMDDVSGIDLTRREQEVFFVLYTSADPVSGKELSHRLGFTPERVNKYVHSMIAKGVPVMRHGDDDLQVALDDQFKTLQAKQEIVEVDRDVREEVQEEASPFMANE